MTPDDEPRFVTQQLPFPLILWVAALLTGCATPMSASEQPHHPLRLETCLANVAHVRSRLYQWGRRCA
jgi:hypothetical protein